MSGPDRVVNVRKWYPVCHHLPPSINSHGAFGSWDMLGFSLPLLHLQIFLIFSVTEILHFALKRFGQPKIVSQIIAGLILGPSALGHIKAVENSLFPLRSQEVISTLSSLGYTLFMFLIGVKMDLGMIRNTGIKAFTTGVVALLAPLVVGNAMSIVVARVFNIENNLNILAAAHALTTFPVIYILLSELKLLNSELGRLGLSSALVSELLSVILVVFAIAYANISKNPVAGWNVLYLTLFVIFAIFIYRPAMFWVIKQTPEGCPVNDVYVMFIILIVLAGSLATNALRHQTLLGCLILGLATPDGPPLGSAIVEKLDIFVMGWFLPVYITTCALRADLISLFAIHENARMLWLNTILIVLMFLVKIVATMIPLLCCKVPFYDAFTLALIISCKGVVELATYSGFRDSENIDTDTFSMMVIVTLLSASVVPALVKLLYHPSRKYAGYQKRSIMHTKPNSEFRIVACIHGEDNTSSRIINLLDASCPTRQNPLAVYVIHLIELVGRATPIFISHQMQKKFISNKSYSKDVIHDFAKYEGENQGAVTVHAFTAISPSMLMHEDICTLALNKLTSLIIIPFHRKWTFQGKSIEAQERYLRTLNRSVLDLAPCSVAIFIDRGHSRKTSKSEYSVAVLFFGGQDDREALCYAKRMASVPNNISVTAVQFVASGDEAATVSWEKMLDSSLFNELKHRNKDDIHINFVEKVVDGGPQTAKMIRSMTHSYDLMIVGRGHDVECPQLTGLIEWCEFPELGVVGDILAADDITIKSSVLVVQQQKQFSG